MDAQARWRRRIRYAWATFLAAAVLGTTYVLFDPDLGTSTPLFAEFSCRGKLDVEVANGFHEPELTAPSSGLFFRATGAGADVPSAIVIERREGDDDRWMTMLRFDDDTGEGYVTLTDVTVKTQVRVQAKDRSGTWCEGESRVIHARAPT